MSDTQTDIRGNADLRPAICFCNSNRAWGGGEKWHLEAALHFARQGYRVFLAARPGSPLWLEAAGRLQAEPELAGNLSCRAFGFGNLSFLRPGRVRAFAAFLKSERVSHVIMNLPADLKTVVLAAIRNGPGSTRLYYRRGSAITPQRGFLNRRLFPCLNAVIANSAETAALVRQAGLLPPERVVVIYNGLDAAAFDAALGEASLRPLTEWNEPFSERNPLIIGSAGRLSRQKAQHYLLHMSAELKRRGFPHRLVLAGDGELRAQLLDLARKLELDFTWQGDSGQVVFTGFLEDMPAFWRSIDLFVLSSIWEGFGYVLAEAMLARKPLLAFACSNMPELVKSGENGLLLPPPGDHERDAAVGARLADKVEELAANPARLRFMGEVGRAFCLRNFDQGAAMRKLEQLLFS